jgi:hypothetical protein
LCARPAEATLLFMSAILDREEYIEQAYFFHALRERLTQNIPAQEVLERLHEEILSTTHLPYAVQFLATELKHSGLLSGGFARLTHYFTPFQAFAIEQTEDPAKRFNVDAALLILEREAGYRAAQVTKPGLFVFQFEALSRNRLGYDVGLQAMIADPFYDDDWRAFLQVVHHQVGDVDFADIIYLRSELYVNDQRRQQPDYEPSVPPLFGDKEGRIAKANRGRDPLYLFSALQRQLGYPEVPRPKPRDDLEGKFEALRAKVRELEMRLKVIDAELKGQVDLTQLLAKPELLQGPGEGDED